MRTVVAGLIPALFWAGAALRIPAARRSAPQRSLCLSLAAFAAALTLNTPAVYVAFDRAVGIPNLADLAEHILGVWGVAGILRWARWVTATTPGVHVRYELAVPGLVAVVLTVLFVAAPLPAEAPSFTAVYGHLPEITAYWLVTVCYFGVTLAALARLSVRYAKRARRPSLRIGLYVLGAGVAFGVAYSLSKLVELVAAQVHADALQDLAATTGHVLLGVGAFTMGAGLLIPRLRAVERTVRWYLAMHWLRRLWETLWQVAGRDILLEEPTTGWQDLRSFRQLERRLSRRVVEIWDGLLALRPYVTDDVTDAALDAATGTGLTGSDRNAAAEACWLAVAVASKRSNRTAVVTAASHTSGAGRTRTATAASRTTADGELAGEVRFLRRLARIYFHSPVVRSFAATHGGHDQGASPVSVDQADNIGVRYGLATAIARLFAPVPLGVALLVFVGERSAARPLAGAGWGLFAAVWAAALPYWLTHRLRANRPGGGHASRWRVLYLAVALLSAVTGIVLLTVLGAPPQVAAATATMVVGLLASLVVNTKWAISNHTAAAGGGAVILSAMVSPVCFVVLGPLVAAVAWARVALRMHTWAQAVAGIALGAAVAAGIFPLLAQ